MASGVDPLICQTFAASPAETGELLFWFRLFRGNNKDSLQWLSPKECIYGIKNKDFDPNKTNKLLDRQ
jgi:hypothetical protein